MMSYKPNTDDVISELVRLFNYLEIIDWYNNTETIRNVNKQCLLDTPRSETIT